MANLKDIKRRIRSVKNTKKITYAMKLVSAAKLKKAQDAVVASRAYSNALYELLSKVYREIDPSEMTHPLLQKRNEFKSVRLVVIGGSRGLCGAYNTNINKRTDQFIRDMQARAASVQISSVLLGKKAIEYAGIRRRPFLKAYDALPEDANQWPIEEIAWELEKSFLKGEVDEVYLLYTQFKSAMTQKVELKKILPLDSDILDVSSRPAQKIEGVATTEQPGITLFEPSAAEVFKAIVPRIMRTLLQTAGLDAKASEYGSRMIAMESATKNAGELAERLTLKHNKLRQTAITAELLDIIGGSEATSA